MKKFIAPEDASNWLKDGKILIHPTEGIWGIGCDASNKTAVSTTVKLMQSSTSKSFILFHLDEKWLTATYKDRKGPRNFKTIDPSNEKLLEFFKQVINKTKLDIVITPGANTNILINDLKKKINKSITGTN